MRYISQNNEPFLPFTEWESGKKQHICCPAAAGSLASILKTKNKYASLFCFAIPTHIHSLFSWIECKTLLWICIIYYICNAHVFLRIYNLTLTDFIILGNSPLNCLLIIKFYNWTNCLPQNLCKNSQQFDSPSISTANDPLCSDTETTMLKFLNKTKTPEEQGAVQAEKIGGTPKDKSIGNCKLFIQTNQIHAYLTLTLTNSELCLISTI